MKKLIRYTKDNWFFYLLGLLAAYFLIFGALANYLNKHYTRDITCTVIDSKIATWGGAKGRSQALEIQTEECDTLTVYKTVQRGADFDDIGKTLESGRGYIFTVNKFELLSGHGIVSGIRDASGGEIDFSPQD